MSSISAKSAHSPAADSNAAFESCFSAASSIASTASRNSSASAFPTAAANAFIRRFCSGVINSRLRTKRGAFPTVARDLPRAGTDLVAGLAIHIPSLYLCVFSSAIDEPGVTAVENCRSIPLTATTDRLLIGAWEGWHDHNSATSTGIGCDRKPRNIGCHGDIRVGANQARLH